MADKVSLSSPGRSAPLSLPKTASAANRTGSVLPTAGKTAMPTAEAVAYVQGKALSDRARDLNTRKDTIDQGIRAAKSAISGYEAAAKLLGQMKDNLAAAPSATDEERHGLQTQFNALAKAAATLATEAARQGAAASEAGEATSEAAPNVAALHWTDETAPGALAEAVDGAMLAVQANTLILGTKVTQLQNRLNAAVTALTNGADKITLAELNEEGANLLALQTRQQVGSQSLSFAGQIEQNVLNLFR